jgi:hypothetical protein
MNSTILCVHFSRLWLSLSTCFDLKTDDISDSILSSVGECDIIFLGQLKVQKSESNKP